MGVVSDKTAKLSATPYKREILLLRRRRRRRRRLRLLLLLLLLIIMIVIIIMGDARVRVKEKLKEGPGTAIDGTVRGPRSMAPCVARERFWGLF